MLLEIQVIGSEEWYETVMPELKILGFREISELGWSDPETDGELMGFYYSYQGETPMPFDEFVETVKEIRKTINDGEAPYIRFNIVADKREKSKQ